MTDQNRHNNYICTFMHVTSIALTFNLSVFSADAIKNFYPYVQIKIFRSRGWSPLVDGIAVQFTCVATVDRRFNLAIFVVDMYWTGIGLQKSLWVQQFETKKQKNNCKRNLLFRPWLELHAGKYTCHLVMRVADKHIYIVNKTIEVKGKSLLSKLYVYV